MYGKEIPDSVRGEQRLTGMTADKQVFLASQGLSNNMEKVDMDE